MKRLFLPMVALVAGLAVGGVKEVQMPESVSTPDGMAVDAAGRLVIATPNVADRSKPGALYRMETPDGEVKQWFRIPDGIGSDGKRRPASPMGICFGPKGEVYVCDNQPDREGRLLRFEIKDDQPVKCEVVACGLENANGVKYLNGKLYLTQAFLRKIKVDGGSASGLYMFDAADRNVRVTDTEADSQMVFRDVTANPKITGGLNGVAVSKDGCIFTGNFGDGHLWKLTPGADGRIVKSERIGKVPRTADGMCVDGNGALYIADMFDCSVQKLVPGGKCETLARGCYVRPSEPCAWKGYIVTANYGARSLAFVEAK